PTNTDQTPVRHRRAGLPGHAHVVEAGVLERLEEAELLERPELPGAVLHLPGLPAVPRAQDEPVDADRPALLGCGEAHSEERLLGADVALLPALPAVGGGEQ